VVSLASEGIGELFSQIATQVFPVYGTELVAVVLFIAFGLIIWKANLPSTVVVPIGLLFFYALSVFFGGIFSTLFMLMMALMALVVILGIFRLIGR
jgi:hypothetical protein